jgi:hypothetical protein
MNVAFVGTWLLVASSAQESPPATAPSSAAESPASSSPTK